MEDNYHLLLHGATTHGIQFVKPEKSMMATSYYAESSGVGRAIVSLPETPRRIGLVGLGTGSLTAVYGPQRRLPAHLRNQPGGRDSARSQFKYLSYAQAKTDIVMGDARLMMERELAQNEPAGAHRPARARRVQQRRDSGAPAHQGSLTKIYLKHLTPNGVLAIHISNRYLDLQPVVEKLAEHFKLSVVTIPDDNEPDWWICATTWMIVTRNQEFLESERIKDVAEQPDANRKNSPLWTDDYASLYSIMK